MFFNSKKPKKESCPDCGSSVDASHQFCAFCSFPLKDQAKEAKNYGLLGRYDSSDQSQPEDTPPGITDKLISSMVSSVMKNFDKQFREIEKDLEKEMRRAPDNTEIKQLPNGITIKFGNSPIHQAPQKKKAPHKKKITEDQVKRLSKLPRAQAKSSVKRLSDKVIYELSTPGVQDPQDVFVSKVETGYEIKAIGSKKVYVNTLPIELPLRRLSLVQNKLLVEFNTQDQ